MGSVTPSSAADKPKRRIAVVGAGPSGAITIDALVREACFDVIRVFERREAPGGCWLDDTGLGTGAAAAEVAGDDDACDADVRGRNGGQDARGDHVPAAVPHPDLEPDMLAALATRSADTPVEVPRDDLLLPGKDNRKNDKNNNSTTPNLHEKQKQYPGGSGNGSPELRAEAARLRRQRQGKPRFAESSIYPYLETNVDIVTMQYSQEPIVGGPPPTARSVAMHGPDTPFRHWTAMRSYVEGLVRRRGYEDMVEYNTTVERADKVGDEWRLTLRKEVVVADADADATGQEESSSKIEDVWWVEWFDGLVVASGHFSVPYIPHVEGLADLVRDRPGSVLHSKQFRGRDAFKDKVRLFVAFVFVVFSAFSLSLSFYQMPSLTNTRNISSRRQRVVVVGASVSAADIAFDLVGAAMSPVHAVMTDRNANPYFGDGAFQHPGIARHPTILRIEVELPRTDSADTADTTAAAAAVTAIEADGDDGLRPRRRRRRVVHFVDGTSVSDVDHIIFGTGYSWTLPFLQHPPSSSSSAPSNATVEIRNNRVRGLYQHVVCTRDPSLLFVGGVGAGLTFKIFEWQAVLAARVLAGRAALPPREEQERWEADRIAEKGDGKGFLTVAPAFEEYFEAVRAMAGPGEGESTEESEKERSPTSSSSSPQTQGEGDGIEEKNRKKTKTNTTSGEAGVGRSLPPFDRAWHDAFMAGHERRKDMWKRRIEEDSKTWAKAES
ncbi:dimethylaniline monooxygenase (N-oxide forming) [Microdochium nivale]|nr:dimethylaniline monooxygenase (N-oxide forming) [Microdochium nivale]